MKPKNSHARDHPHSERSGIGTLPEMRLRNPKRDPSKPFVYIALTPLRVDRQFDFAEPQPKRSGECNNTEFA